MLINLISKWKTVIMMLVLACGIFATIFLNPPTAHAVLNGERVSPDEYPYFVGIGHWDSDVVNCGGALIHPEWVLTAKHCQSSTNLPLSLPIGTHHDANNKKRSNQLVEVEGITRYRTDRGLTRSDLGLYKLAEPVWGTKVDVATSDSDTPINNSKMLLVGGGNYLSDANQLAQDVIRDNKNIPFRESNPFDWDNLPTFSAGRQGVGGGCRKDSGSPLLFNGNLFGVQSFGDMCEGSDSSGYMNIVATDVQNWLHCNVPLDHNRTTVVEGYVDISALVATGKLKVNNSVKTSYNSEELKRAYTTYSDVVVKVWNGAEWKECHVNFDENGIYRAYLPADVVSGAGSVTISVPTHIYSNGSDRTTSHNWHGKDFIVHTDSDVQITKGKHHTMNSLKVETEMGVYDREFNSISSYNNSVNGYGEQEPYGGVDRPILPGKIQAEHYDDGGQGVAYHDRDAINHATKYGNSNPLRPDDGVDQGWGIIAWFYRNEWVEYTVAVPENSLGKEAHVVVRASSVCGNNKKAKFQVTTDSGDSISVTIPNTGRWGTYRTWRSSNTISFGKTTTIIRVKNTGQGCAANLDWFSFE